MAVNLLDPNVFYYHPMTRMPLRPRSLIQWPDGIIVEEKVQPFKVQFKPSLSCEDIVSEYYARVSAPSMARDLKRDCGAIMYMVQRRGLDLVLYSIDCLVDSYLESEDRSGKIPDIISAGDYSQEASDRIGVSKQVALQYGIGEAAWQHGN